MRNVYIYSYKPSSEGANALADNLGVPLIDKDVNLTRYDNKTIIFNWGMGSSNDILSKCRVFNRYSNVAACVNKIETFRALSLAGVSHVPFTTDYAIARDWQHFGYPVCVRALAEGADGAGLTIVRSNLEPIPHAPLYTKFIKAKAEYRVNVCNDTTMAVQLKVPLRSDQSTEIRTTAGGWGFRLLDENEIPIGLRPVARAATKALGLDYAGVDMIHGEDGKFYVLELNSAPHLTPAVATRFAKEFKKMVETYE
jgi:glutathione synthase/RimK-type ligase-like ATP-grasp enzyme